MANANVYVPINSDDLAKRMVKIEDCWKDFLGKMLKYYSNESKDIELDYSVNVLALREVVERVYQRKDYFKRYHSGMRMSEYKEIGLTMFWISKFKPFNITGHGYDDKIAFNINDDFAMYYMLLALKNLAEELKLEYNSDKLTGRLYDEMLYSLSFRDISKEALGILVELVANIVILNLPGESEE
ncbi:MAG: hypothetical protein E7597_08490 [Ruminococcaceae bacterium]|nr:hypothetical protein [Oscillospiraceae bacterium]